MNKLLVVTYGGGHVNIIKQLYYELIDKFEVTILALTMAKETLLKEGIPFKDLAYYNNILIDNDDIVGIGESFIKKHSIDYSKIGLEDTILYYGYNVRDYIKLFGESDLDIEYARQGRAVFLPLLTMRKIIKFERPNAIITTNSPRFERAAILVSKEMGIPNFSIEDLFGDSRLFSSKENSLYSNYYGDYVFTFNHEVKRKLIERKVTAKDIVESGQPAFEDILNIDYNIEYIKSQLEISRNQRIILWASHYSMDENFIFDHLVKIFSGREDIILIIKPHPNEKVDYMSEVIKKSNFKNIKLVRNFNIREMISISEIVLTQASTSGLEAILLNKPLIVLNPSKMKYTLDYSKLGLALNVENIDEIIDKIDSFYDENNELAQKVLLNISKFGMCSNSSNIITDYIYKILNENNAQFFKKGF